MVIIQSFFVEARKIIGPYFKNISLYLTSTIRWYHSLKSIKIKNMRYLKYTMQDILRESDRLPIFCYTNNFIRNDKFNVYHGAGFILSIFYSYL